MTLIIIISAQVVKMSVTAPGDKSQQSLLGLITPVDNNFKDQLPLH